MLEGWPEVADFNRNVLDVVLGHGETLAYRDQHFILWRNGQADDVFKEARRLTDESEAKWLGLFERMNEGFFLGEVVRDATGRMVDFLFVKMNPAFEVQTGIAIADASGRSMREVVPGIPDELMETYAKVVDTGEPAQFEVHVPVRGCGSMPGRERSKVIVSQCCFSMRRIGSRRS